ncbi:uncharacterized protein LOC111054143 [Nilaparvata lugens]|uniref:uncharacterized protein LOC120350475 n=1 Tax=Nilaparvata lugens TaxID=108931 RepID=UPI00193DA8A5|nr:uncharacterized protein LOC120350475 [Nilaparvata lugens]XP_039279898.1 uncharacterized protein LOC111054143 [Nilaparvata lugens]
MEKKSNQTRPSQFKRVAVDDIMNINDSASKKKKQSVPAHLRPSTLKKLKLKPDPTLLFSQFEPKSQDNKIDASAIHGANETACSQVNKSKDPSKVGISKGWTPPLKNAAQQKESKGSSQSFKRVGILKECKNVKKVELNVKLPSNVKGGSPKTKENSSGKNSNTKNQNTSRNSHEIIVKNSLEVDRDSSNVCSQYHRGILHMEDNQNQSDPSNDSPHRSHFETLLEAINIVESDGDHSLEIDHSNTYSSQQEAGNSSQSHEFVDTEQLDLFKEDKNEQIPYIVTPLKETHSNELSVMEGSQNSWGQEYQDGVANSPTKESYEFDTQPVPQFTNETCVQKNQSAELAHVTVYEDLKTLETTVDCGESVQIKSTPDLSGNAKLDECHNDCLLTSSCVNYTETLIENLKYPVFCTIVNEARDSTEVLKFSGSDCSKNKNKGLNQVESKTEASQQFRQNHERENNLEDGNDYSVVDEGIDAEDEKIIKEIRIYVYDSLTSDEKNDGNSNYIEYGGNGKETYQKPDMASQNCEKCVVTSFRPEINNENVYEKELEIGEESKEECEGPEIFYKMEENEEESEGIKYCEQTIETCDEERERYQKNSSNEYFDYQQNKDETIVEGEGEADENEESNLKKEEVEILECNSSESDKDKVGGENDDEANENEGAGRSNIGDNKSELWNEDDDVFDEVIDMSCTQLINIENEYSNKKKADEKVGNDTNNNATLRNKPGDSNIRKVRIPWVNDDSKKAEKASVIPDQNLQWIERMREEKQKLRAVVQELSQLNALILQARQTLWPSMLANKK